MTLIEAMREPSYPGNFAVVSIGKMGLRWQLRRTDHGGTKVDDTTETIQHDMVSVPWVRPLSCDDQRLLKGLGRAVVDCNFGSVVYIFSVLAIDNRWLHIFVHCET
jgi:hypothetical protein